MPASLDLPGLRVLTCATCQTRFVLGDLDPEANCRCARCDRSITHPSGSFDTLRDVADPRYLYAIAEAEAPSEP